MKKLFAVLCILCMVCAGYVSAGAEGEAPSYKAGETVSFGRFEQDGDETDGPEELEWIVLESDGEIAVMISRYALVAMPYCETGNAQWKNCSLRQWLNDAFLEEAFTVEEQGKLVLTELNEDKEKAGSGEVDRSTVDRVYLLTMREIKKYNLPEESRQSNGIIMTVSDGQQTLVESVLRN